MPNNSVEIVKNLQELANIKEYTIDKIIQSMENTDETVLQEVVDFFLGLGLEDLKKLKTFCDDLQSVNKIRQEQPGYGDGLILLWKQGVRQILSTKIIPIVEKQEGIKRIFAICDELKEKAGKGEEEVYKYLNGFFICRGGAFTTDDMQLIEKESYKTLFRDGNESVIEFLHQAVVANLALDDDEFRTLIKSFVKDQAPNNFISIIDCSSTSCCCSLAAFLTF